MGTLPRIYNQQNQPTRTKIDTLTQLLYWEGIVFTVYTLSDVLNVTNA